MGAPCFPFVDLVLCSRENHFLDLRHTACCLSHNHSISKFQVICCRTTPCTPNPSSSSTQRCTEWRDCEAFKIWCQYSLCLSRVFDLLFTLAMRTHQFINEWCNPRTHTGCLFRYYVVFSQFISESFDLLLEDETHSTHCHEHLEKRIFKSKLRNFFWKLNIDVTKRFGHLIPLEFPRLSYNAPVN